MPTYDRAVERLDARADVRIPAERRAADLMDNLAKQEKFYAERQALDDRIRALCELIEAQERKLNDDLGRCGYDVDQLVNVRGDVFRLGEDKAEYVGAEPDDEDEDGDHDEVAEWASQYRAATAVR